MEYDEDDPDHLERLQDASDWQAQQSAAERSYAGLARPWWSEEAYIFFSSLEGTDADLANERRRRGDFGKFNPDIDKVAPSTKRIVTKEMREERQREAAMFEAMTTMPKPEYFKIAPGKNWLQKCAHPIIVRRRIENRQVGLALPSIQKQAVEHARRVNPSSLIPEERPDVLMWGGRDILPEMHKETELMRRRGEVDGAHVDTMRDERELQVPQYLQHFANGWTPFDPAESDEERREAKADAEKKAVEKKRKRAHAHDLKGRMYNEKQSGATLLDRLALLEALEDNDKTLEEPTQAKQLADEWRATRKKMKAADPPTPQLPPELDIENVIWPDPVPAYLLERKEYYFIRKSKNPERWWKETAKPPKKEWWHDIPQHTTPTIPRQPFTTLCDNKENGEESSSDPEIVDEPPDVIAF